MDQLVDIYFDEIKAETDLAFLFKIAGSEFWIPKSKIDNANTYGVGDLNDLICIPEWLAIDKGLV